MQRFQGTTRLVMRRLLWAALGIEFLDELVDGVSGAAWPLMRTGLDLNYLQIGLLMAVPALLANLIEPVFSLLADFVHRHKMVLWGIVGYGAALWLWSLSGNFVVLLLALLLYHVAAGVSVNLTQAAWMDADPERREQNMARWALAGSVGNVLGPLLVSLAVWMDVGWRPVYLLMGVGMALILWVALPATPLLKSPVRSEKPLEDLPSAAALVGQVSAGLARPLVLRYLMLLEAANLMLDVFRGFIALYFVDVLGTGAAGGSFAVLVLTVVGLLGDVLVLPVLERISGLRYLRTTAWMVVALLPLFLLSKHLVLALGLLGLLGMLTAGWYAVLQARLYAALPEQSGVVLALGSVVNLLGSLIPWLLGAVAHFWGLQTTLWLLLLGPVALLVWLPRNQTS